QLDCGGIAGISGSRIKVFFNQQKTVRMHIKLCGFLFPLFLIYFRNITEILVFYAFFRVGTDVAL
ncbi:MAG: hypothetical protein AAB065_08300, partial [Deltaproteobacteria bacterium]